jgi:aspartate aminotransferase
MPISLANRLQTIEESATLALNTKAKIMAASGKTIYNLTAGEPSMDTPGYIKSLVSEKLDRNHYTPPAGMTELREAIAKHCREFYNSDWINGENVMVTAGGKPGLYLSFLATINPGDEVILPVPGWVSYKYLIELAGGVVVEAKLDDVFDLNCTEIEKNISPKTKAVIINSPNNPTGAVYSAKSLQKLAGILGPTGITVFSDDMYAKLVFDESFKPVTTFGFKNLIISSGFSKSQALTGWRIGYVVADKEIIKATTKLQSHLLGNTSTLSQYGAIAALKENDKPPMLGELKSNLEVMSKLLNEIPKIKFVPPGGAFYVLIDIRNLAENSIEWCERLLVEKGVAVIPGEAFSAPGFIRLSFACDKKTLESGLKRLKEFVEETK